MAVLVVRSKKFGFFLFILSLFPNPISTEEMDARYSLSLLANGFITIPTSTTNNKFTCRISRSLHRKFSCLAIAAPATVVNQLELENKKHDLLGAIQDTQRGFITDPDQRCIIEEALVSLEGFNMGLPIDLDKLDGTWRLQYTSAPDVLILLQSAATLPFFQVGQIFQKFECKARTDGGIIRNVVQWSIPSLLEDQDGATLLVSAKFSVVSVRHIYLQFEEIALQNIKISEGLQAVIAPAILPRSYLSLQILQLIRSFRAQFPVGDPGRRQSVGGLYYLSYLDGKMLVGRAVGGGGVFVFTKSQPLSTQLYE